MALDPRPVHPGRGSPARIMKGTPHHEGELMRVFGIGIALAVALSLVTASTAQAQLVCSLGGGFGQSPYNPYLNQADSPYSRAAQELDQIYRALCSPSGCGSYLVVNNPTVPNAMAAAMGLGQTMIGYQPAFMDRIAREYGDGATFGILAHEFGHHIDFHTTPPWMNSSWSRELKADAWAGCALARTGISTASLENALRAIAQFPSASHPGWPQRLQAVRHGFVSCGGRWPLRNGAWNPSYPKSRGSVEPRM